MLERLVKLRGKMTAGDQLVNHIANCQLLTNKMGLLNSLQEYERVTYATKGRLPRLKMSDFVPETYRLDNREDRETFLRVYKDNEIWISKPTGMNQGKGIFLLRKKEQIDQLLSDREAKQQQRKMSRPLMSRIVQRYIHNPLLLEGRKFDIRAYMLISSTVPYLVLYHKGYVRLSCHKYDGEDENLSTHLTNQFIQKKVPNYCEVKEDTAWSMDKFNDYINDNVASDKSLELNWVYNTLTKQMQRIMLHCFNSVKHKLQCKVGYFDLYGLDFMVDQDMKIWLIEININPCLATNCSALKEVIPGIVEETIHLSVECFEKSRKNQPLMPLQSLKTFNILYCGNSPNCQGPRQTRSVSPVKENNPEKAQPTHSSTNYRSGRSPGRAVPRVSIATTPLTQSPYSSRKSEFATIVNPQGSAGGKTTSGTKTTVISKPVSSTTKTSPAGVSSASGATEKVLKANSNNNASTKPADTKSSANKTSESTKSKQETGDSKKQAGSTQNSGDKTQTGKGTKVQNGGKVNSDTKGGKDDTKRKDGNGTQVQRVSDKKIQNGDTKVQNNDTKQQNKNVAQQKGSGVESSIKDKGDADTTGLNTNDSKTAADSLQLNLSESVTNTDCEPEKTPVLSKTKEAESEPSASQVMDVPGKSEAKSAEGASSPETKPSSRSASLSPKSLGDDVKLKMTHAKGSASRKNRPRAHTGN